MTYTSIISLAAVVGLVIYMVYMTARNHANRKSLWVFPAGLSLLFLAYSVQTVVTEGLTGFWVEHTSSLWGTQIWVDLLIAIGIGWYFAVPKAKALGMNVMLWVLVILASGCIGFLAMVSRIFYLEGKATAQPVV